MKKTKQTKSRDEGRESRAGKNALRHVDVQALNKAIEQAVTDAPLQERQQDAGGTLTLDAGELKRVARTSIVPSPTNPRTTFDVVDMVKSIKQHGIITPLIVRKCPKYNGSAPKGEYELVAGERRWRAAGELKLSEVPVLVRVLTDEQAWELQQIENLQRTDLTELEEAEGFQRVIDRKIYGDTWTASVKALADKLNKSPGHITNRLTLLKLAAAPRQALTAGKLDLTIAMVIASIPNPEAQQQAMKVVTEGQYRNDGPMTFKQAREYITEHFRKSLQGAPFNGEDATLLPDAGICSKCPKRVAPNVCTDTVCYQKKREASFARQIEVAKKNGQKVLSGEEYDRLRYSSGLINLDDECYDDPKYRKWSALLKGSDVKPMVAIDKREERLVELLPKADALDACKKLGIKFRKSETSDWEVKRRKEQAENREVREVLKTVFDQAVPKITEAAKTKHVNDTAFWKTLAALAMRRIGESQGGNEESRLVKILNLKLAGESWTAAGRALDKHFESLSSCEDFRQFAILCFVVEGWLDFYKVQFGEDFTAFAALYNVDLAAMRKQVAEARANKKKGKPAKQTKSARAEAPKGGKKARKK